MTSGSCPPAQIPCTTDERHRLQQVNAFGWNDDGGDEEGLDQEERGGRRKREKKWKKNMPGLLFFFFIFFRMEMEGWVGAWVGWTKENEMIIKFFF